MTIPYDYDQTNIDHLSAVIDEQEATIEYLHERCKAEEVESAKLRELVAEIYPYAKAYLQEWRVLGCIDSKSYDWYLRLLELGVEVSA